MGIYWTAFFGGIIISSLVFIDLYRNFTLDRTIEINNESEVSVKRKFSKKRIVYIMCMIFNMILNCIISYFVLNNASNKINMIKLCVLLIIISIAAVVDYEKRIIPNYLIGVGIIVRLLLYVVEYVRHGDLFVSIIKSDLIGFGFGFGLLFFVAIITKNAIGFGDVKLYGLIGLMSGFYCIFSTLFLSMVGSVIISVIFLVMKKKTIKDSLPLGPCIYLGYVATILLGCY